MENLCVTLCLPVSVVLFAAELDNYRTQNSLTLQEQNSMSAIQMSM